MNVWIITRRELNSLFLSSIAYLVGSAFLFVTGFFFFFTVALGELATLTEVFSVIGVILIFIAPILTMRLIAEEARSGTLELLMTAPVRDWEVIVGKFMAAFILYLAMLTPTFYYLFLLTRYGNPDIPVTLAGYLGVILMGAMLIGIGVLTSTLSSNQIVSGVLGIAISLSLWMLGSFAPAFDGLVADFIHYLSIQRHFTDFLLGLITTANIVYFLSMTITPLFLATRILEARRWN